MAALLPTPRRIRGPPRPLPGGPLEWLEALKKKELLKEKQKARLKKRFLKSITMLEKEACSLQSELAALARKQAEMVKIRAQKIGAEQAGKLRLRPVARFNEAAARKQLRPPMKGGSLRVRTVCTLSQFVLSP